MYVLFSGEGATDCGTCHMNTEACKAESFDYGPMVVMADHIIQECCGYSIIEYSTFGCVSKHLLIKRAKELKAPRSPRLPGKKAPRETAYYFTNARVFANCAKEWEESLDDTVVAVLFRDCDGTASAERGLWQHKWESMQDGFEYEEFARGVPMLPKPKSEAWFICARKANPYQHCAALEDESGNDNSPNSLKKQLAALCGVLPSRQDLVDMINDGSVAVARIDMPSFNAFRDRLQEAVASC